MTRAPEINEKVLMDLGNLRCGLTEDLIDKLTKAALEVHLEEIQSCPLKEREAKALVNKALGQNVYVVQCDFLTYIFTLLIMNVNLIIIL